MVQCRFFVHKKLGAYILYDPKAQAFCNTRFFRGKKIKAVWWTFQVHAIYGNDFDWPARHVVVIVEIANGKERVTSGPEKPNKGCILQSVRPIDVARMYLEDNMRSGRPVSRQQLCGSE